MHSKLNISIHFQIKYHCDDAHKDSERHWLSVAVEHKMLALFSSAFECSFLLAATLSALFSIVTPKVRNGLNKMLLIAVPLMALMPAFATAATDEGNADGVRQQQQQPSDEMPAPASSANWWARNTQEALKERWHKQEKIFFFGKTENNDVITDDHGYHPCQLFIIKQQTTWQQTTWCSHIADTQQFRLWLLNILAQISLDS